MKLIIVGNQAVNTDQIVWVTYKPKRNEGVSILRITSTDADPDAWSLDGDEADAVWAHLQLVGVTLKVESPLQSAPAALTPADSAAMSEQLKNAG